MFFLVPKCVDTRYSVWGMETSCPTAVDWPGQDCKDEKLAKACPVSCGKCGKGKHVFSANHIRDIPLT